MAGRMSIEDFILAMASLDRQPREAARGSSICDEPVCSNSNGRGRGDLQTPRGVPDRLSSWKVCC